MFKFVLVPATGAPTDAPVFSAALGIARQAAGHIKFLHIRPNVQAIIAAMAASDLGGGGGYDELIKSLENDVAGRDEAAEAAFREFTEREKIVISNAVPAISPSGTSASGGSVSAEWKVETGDEATYLAEHGRVADLIVVGRPREGEAVALDVLEVSLMHSGRPVLIVPDVMPYAASGTLVIAWKNKTEAARAVTAAQPLVAAAKQVIILSVREGAGTADPSCERLREVLLWHNPNTTIRRLTHDGRHDAEILLGAAIEAKADMLVMGGYGHSRVREMILGGCTQRVLSGADVPIFMAH